MTGYLGRADVTAAAQALFDGDVDDVGYIMNASRLWAHLPEAVDDVTTLARRALRTAQLRPGEREVVVAATAAAIGDSYCALVWGAKLAAVTDPDTAAAVLRGDGPLPTDRMRVLAQWVRKVARQANGIGADDVRELHDLGLTDRQIFAVTLFATVRILFSTVNDALGACPDAPLRFTVPAGVRDAVDFGRPIDASPL
ncbi:MAG: hypothetical protein HOV79_05660 [Hamadaea sp.]|nr:hypothetical protein [Hamadaea sp.]